MLRAFLFLLITTTLLPAGRKPVMVKMISKNLSKPVVKGLRGGVENRLTTRGYGLISLAVQNEALKEQAMQQQRGCYDERCLVDTGRMVAARELLMITVGSSGKQYYFEMKLIDLEGGNTIKSDLQFIPKKELKSMPAGYHQGQRLINHFFQKTGERGGEEEEADSGMIDPPAKEDDPKHILNKAVDTKIYSIRFRGVKDREISTTNPDCDVNNSEAILIRGTECHFKLERRGFETQYLDIVAYKDREIIVEWKPLQTTKIVDFIQPVREIDQRDTIYQIETRATRSIQFRGISDWNIYNKNPDCDVTHSEVVVPRGTRCHFTLKRDGFKTQHLDITALTDQVISVKWEPVKTVQRDIQQPISVKSVKSVKSEKSTGEFFLRIGFETGYLGGKRQYNEEGAFSGGVMREMIGIEYRDEVSVYSMFEVNQFQNQIDFKWDMGMPIDLLKRLRHTLQLNFFVRLYLFNPDFFFAGGGNISYRFAIKKQLYLVGVIEGSGGVGNGRLFQFFSGVGLEFRF